MHTIQNELQAIESWSQNNNLTLNTKKSTEIIICRPKSWNANLPPPPFPGIQRVDQMVVLGVTVQNQLSFKPYIDCLVSRCAQTFFALGVLRSNGLSGNALWDVTQAMLINKMLYASPLWWGFIDASDKQRLQSVLNKAVKLGFLPKLRPPCRNSAYKALFSNISHNQNHVLHNLLPSLKMTGHDLRRLTWDRSQLTKDANNLIWKIFIHQITIISIPNYKIWYLTHSFITAAFLSMCLIYV